MTGRIDLSMCVITCNDEKHIRSCLRQVRGVAGEVIVADIGSADSTSEIARQEGAQVYPVLWGGDFSAVKNFCMDRARGRWVLFLQPNETVAEEHLQKLQGLLENPNAEAYLTLVDYNSAGFAISSPVQSLRLLRNRIENRFRYRSFEAVPDEALTGIVNSTVEIKQAEDATLSWELNARCALLQDEAAANPADSYLQYMLGLLRLNESRFEESAACLQNARSGVNPGALFAPHLYKCLGAACLCLERYGDALEALDEGAARCPFYTDLLILRAEIHKRFERYDKAIGDLDQCLRTRQLVDLSVPRPEIGDASIFVSLGEISEAMHNDRDALNYYLQSFQLDPADTELPGKIGELAELTGSTNIPGDLASMIKDRAAQSDDFIHLTMPLAAAVDFEGIRASYARMPDEDMKAELICRVAVESLRQGHMEMACRMKALAAGALPQELERLLRAGCMLWELQEETADFQNIARDGLSGRPPPDQGTAGFLRALCGLPEGGEELTAAQAHGGIGDHYLASGKNTEAFSAYARALQAEPWNYGIHRKILGMAGKVPAGDELLLRLENADRQAWVVGGGVWDAFTEGLKELYGGSFARAYGCFARETGNAETNRLFHAYAAACLWLGRHGGGDMPQQQSDPDAYSEMEVLILLNYLLCCVSGAPGSYTDLYLLMEERICGLIYSSNQSKLY